MSDKKETVGSIIKDMYGPKFYPWGQGGFSVEMDLTPLARRLADAYKRELGNAQKMREALKEMIEWAESALKHHPNVFIADALEQIKVFGEQALSAPPRNCDRFGGGAGREVCRILQRQL